ncbi:MAG: sigma-E processing peptidase SpoIIGA [Acetanaerobacterium sp.]
MGDGVREQVVYIDVLLGVNLLINYFLLLLTSRLAAVPVKRLRLLAASALGSVYSLVILAPRLALPLDLVLKAVFAATITIAAFGLKNKGMFVRAYCVFLASTFLFGGVFIALYFLTSPKGMLVNNSSVYLDISVLQLIIYTITAYLGLTLASYIAKRRAPRELSYQVTIGFRGRKVSLHAIVDTGNSLKETFSQYPVAVCGFTDIRELLPARLCEIIGQTDAAQAMQSLGASEFAAAVRIIPYHDVSGEGMLFAFRPDSFSLEQNKKVLHADRVYVGVSQRAVTRLDYSCILNPQIIELSSEKRSAQCYES